jgi:hypothetical protein
MNENFGSWFKTTSRQIQTHVSEKITPNVKHLVAKVKTFLDDHPKTALTFAAIPASAVFFLGLGKNDYKPKDIIKYLVKDGWHFTHVDDHVKTDHVHYKAEREIFPFQFARYGVSQKQVNDLRAKWLKELNEKNPPKKSKKKKQVKAERVKVDLKKQQSKMKQLHTQEEQKKNPPILRLKVASCLINKKSSVIYRTGRITLVSPNTGKTMLSNFLTALKYTSAEIHEIFDRI